MDRITCHELPELFQGAADIFGGEKGGALRDGCQNGDGPGPDHAERFGALPQLIRDNEAEGDIGKTLMKAGMKMAGLVPSTMGTLMSSGIMEGGKAIGKKGEMGPKELAEFLAGFARGIAHRGKCQLGDRTILDAVDAGAKKAQEACAEGADMGAMLRRAAEGAKEGVKATEDMLPKYGKAAVFSAKAKGVPDQGAVAGQYFLEGLGRYFLGNLK